MAKRKMDKLSLDMIECKKAGFGCHYGAWKATQDNPVIVKAAIPEGWQVCQWCGKAFKPNVKKTQKYCEIGCQRQSQYEKDRRARLKKRGADNGQTENAGAE